MYRGAPQDDRTQSEALRIISRLAPSKVSGAQVALLKYSMGPTFPYLLELCGWLPGLGSRAPYQRDQIRRRTRGL